MERAPSSLYLNIGSQGLGNPFNYVVAGRELAGLNVDYRGFAHPDEFGEGADAHALRHSYCSQIVAYHASSKLKISILYSFPLWEK